jgi:putative ABC transport system permease protein
MLVDDLKHGYRRFRSRPAMMLAAATMLALGIGLTTAMFTVVDALILRPVPFRDAERLAQVWLRTKNGGRSTVAPAVFGAWRGSPAFAAVEGAVPGVSVVETPSGPIVRASARVSTGTFAMLGVGPIRGRTFDASEGRAGVDDRVVISEDVWRAGFGADRSLVGHQVRIDGALATVVGIMPSEFRFPEWNTAVWRPIDFLAPPPALANEAPRPYVRLAHGVPLADAMKAAADLARPVDPSMTPQTWAEARPMAGFTDAYYERAIPLLAGGVGLVFLILCANVCSLLLARLTSREREFRMCSALGASRARLLRQTCIEHGLLGAAGAVIGVWLAGALISLSRGFLPEAFLLRTLNPVDLDGRALAIAGSAGIVATLAAGLLPAWIGTRGGTATSISGAERTATEGRGARALTRVLLVAEVALSCTLLVAATLLVRSFVNLASVDRGLDTDGVLTTWISLPPQPVPDRAARAVLARALHERVRSLPGVDRVALTNGVPTKGDGIYFFDDWVAEGSGRPPQSITAESYSVGPEFFELYGIPLRRGRTFQPGDPRTAVVIGERLAARLWPGEDPVGRAFRFGQQRYDVIGVAREITFPSLNALRDLPEFYRGFELGGRYVWMNIKCHAACPPEAALRQEILAAVPAASIVSLGPLAAAYGEELARPRAAAALGSTFAIIAVLAAAGGLFSVLSYAVGRRRREFGIRIALGASPAEIRGLVLRDGALVALAGAAIGIGLAAALARGMASLEFGVTGLDPVTWLVVTLVLCGTTLLASWRPARRAMRVDPVALLREE